MHDIINGPTSFFVKKKTKIENKFFGSCKSYKNRTLSHCVCRQMCTCFTLIWKYCKQYIVLYDVRLYDKNLIAINLFIFYQFFLFLACWSKSCICMQIESLDCKFGSTIYCIDGVIGEFKGMCG